MSVIYENAIVAKSNILNEMRFKKMTLQQLRFFSIYISKINPWDISTRVVVFPLSDFQKIMEIGRMNIQSMKDTVNTMLTQVVSIPNDRGGFTAFQIFKEFELYKNENDEWFVKIDAHDKALPLMFDLKKRYFKYELWNALRLKSKNQLRLYEILKQYEFLGKREIAVADLQALLGIEPDEYEYWQNFKVRVLDSCQQAINELTDISFTYEKGKSGRGGKWLTIIFTITKNKNYKDPLALKKFIGIPPSPDSFKMDGMEICGNAKPKKSKKNVKKKDEEEIFQEDEFTEIDYGSPLANLLGDAALHNEFSKEEVLVLKDLVMQAVPSKDHLKMCDYLVSKYNILNTRKVKKRFAYLCAMIANDITDIG